MICVQPRSSAVNQSVRLPFPPVAAGFALLAADLAATPWLGHERPPFLGQTLLGRPTGYRLAFISSRRGRQRYNAPRCSVAFAAAHPLLMTMSGHSYRPEDA